MTDRANRAQRIEKLKRLIDERPTDEKVSAWAEELARLERDAFESPSGEVGRQTVTVPPSTSAQGDKAKPLTWLAPNHPAAEKVRMIRDLMAKQSLSLAEKQDLQRLRLELARLATTPEAPARVVIGPPFPREAYVGVAADFAQLYSEHLESPPQFFYMDFLTVLGAIVCDRVRLASELREPPRLYEIKVGRSWLARKSYSQDKTIEFFQPLIADDAAFKIKWGVGSDRGLARELSGNRCLLVYDEFKHFVDKSRTSSLLTLTNELFGKTDYDGDTKDATVTVRDGHLTILGACTVHTFERMFSSDFRDIGFLNRILLVWGEREKELPFPSEIPSERRETLQARVREIIAATQSQSRPAFDFAPDARRLYDEWSKGWLGQSVYHERLDTMMLRLLPLYALITLSERFERSHVEALIHLMECQYQTRKSFDPVDSSSKIARCEQKILRVLEKGQMGEARVKDLTHARDQGIWFYKKAWGNLEKEGYVLRISSGRGWQCLITDAGKRYMNAGEGG